MARAPGKFAFAFIFITVTLNMIGFGVIMPVMPQLIMDVTGEDLSRAAQWGGYLSLVYALMQFVMMPIIGGLSDRFGRRPVLLLSMAAYAFDFLIMAIAPVIGVIVVARVLAGAFAATFSTANAYVADISPPEKRAANFGLMGAAFGLGFIIGPGIGGVLGDQFGPRAPFYFVAALGALNFLFGLLVLPETLTKEDRRPFEWKRANAFGSFREFAKYPIMLPIAGVLFLSQLAYWTYPSVWSYYAEEKFAWTTRPHRRIADVCRPHRGDRSGRSDADRRSAVWRARNGDIRDVRHRSGLSRLRVCHCWMDGLRDHRLLCAWWARAAGAAGHHVAHDAIECARGTPGSHRRRLEHIDDSGTAHNDANLRRVFRPRPAVRRRGRDAAAGGSAVLFSGRTVRFLFFLGGLCAGDAVFGLPQDRSAPAAGCRRIRALIVRLASGPAAHRETTTLGACIL